MNTEFQERIRESWHDMKPRSGAVAAAFYQRLFDMNPPSRDLFAGIDMDGQKHKFMAMIDEVVRVVGDPSLLVGESAAWGRRHMRYGVRERDYTIVESALLWAMEREGGPDFTAETREAWGELYRLIAAVMTRAATKAATQERIGSGDAVRPIRPVQYMNR